MRPLERSRGLVLFRWHLFDGQKFGRETFHEDEESDRFEKKYSISASDEMKS